MLSMRKLVLGVSLGLLVMGGAQAAPTGCGKTVVECQKLVDNQARIIVILQIKLGDYLNELAQAHDALETNTATQKAAQQAQAKH